MRGMDDKSNRSSQATKHEDASKRYLLRCGPMQLPNDRDRQRENRYVCHDVGYRIADEECVVVNATFGRVIGITIPESRDRLALENDY